MINLLIIIITINYYCKHLLLYFTICSDQETKIEKKREKWQKYKKTK